MEAGVKERTPPSDDGADQVTATPRKEELSPEEARRLEREEARQDAAVEAFNRDHEELTEEDEQDALDYLLAPKKPRLYDVAVQYDTDDGRVPLTFVVRGMDGRKLEEMEKRHRSETTGELDVIGYDCELVATACEFLESRRGRKIKINSDEFLTVKVPDPDNPDGELIEQKIEAPPVALEARFRTQLGLLSGVARSIRFVSGYDPQRVGEARRRLVNASGNS